MENLTNMVGFMQSHYNIDMWPLKVYTLFRWEKIIREVVILSCEGEGHPRDGNVVSGKEMPQLLALGIYSIKT